MLGTKEEVLKQGRWKKLSYWHRASKMGAALAFHLPDCGYFELGKGAERSGLVAGMLDSKTVTVFNDCISGWAPSVQKNERKSILLTWDR